MKTVFADTSYWVALLHPKDALHEKARAAETKLGSCRLLTTEMVLTEFLNDFGGRGEPLRQAASVFVEALRQTEEVEIVSQTPEQFQTAFEMYQERSDKSWSLTDCASCLVMLAGKLTEALTYDRHFEQMGFKALLRD